MTDGFSQPDPAVPDTDDADGDDVTLVDEFPALTDDPAEVETDAALVTEDSSCLDCSHFETCAIFKGIKPMMDDWHTDEPPVDVERLAWHCAEYDPRDGEQAQMATEPDA